MARQLTALLQALIDTGHREDHTAIILTLGDGTVLRFATGNIQVGTDLYLGELAENDPLKMSLQPAQDGCTLKVQNVDKVFGQTLTSISNALDGATAMLGLAFKDKDSGNTWFDPKMPGDIIAGEINETEVQLNFVGDIYAAQVVGETIASVFPYQTPPSALVISDPNDIRDPNDPFGIGPGHGRLPGHLGFLPV
jgi:hypothetical protein